MTFGNGVKGATSLKWYTLTIPLRLVVEHYSEYVEKVSPSILTTLAALGTKVVSQDGVLE